MSAEQSVAEAMADRVAWDGREYISVKDAARLLDEARADRHPCSRCGERDVIRPEPGDVVVCEPCMWEVLAADLDLTAAKAKGLREAAADIEADWAPVWGGDSMWMTTGTKVAALVADTLRAMALEIEP